RCVRTGAAPPARSSLSLHDALPISRSHELCLFAVLSILRPGFEPLERNQLLLEPLEHLQRRRHQVVRPIVARQRKVAQLPHQLRSEEHTSELQSPCNLVCRPPLEKKKPSPQTQRLYEEIRAKRALEPELSAELWERVGDLRVLSVDTAGAVKAFGCAVEAAGSGDVLARLRRRIAGAWLLQHGADAAEPHLAAAEKLASDPAERGRVACLRANQAWERG